MAYSPKPPKTIVWVGRARRELRKLPAPVRDVMGYALFLAQHGELHPAATRLRGDLRGLIEVRDDWRGDTYRVVYTDKLPRAVYVLHAFQKKSRRGGEIPQRARRTVQARLRAAREHHAARLLEESTEHDQP